MTDLSCQIYLVVDAGRPGAQALLNAALGAGPVASILITTSGQQTLDAVAAAPLLQLAQAQGVAVLIDGNAPLAKYMQADGVHVTGDEPNYKEARRAVGPRAMVGIGLTPEVRDVRHAAMACGEAGADYVAFAEHIDQGEAVMPAARPVDSDISDADGDETGDAITPDLPRSRLDLVRWWAEIFTVPCVAWHVTTLDDATELAAAGADFIALAPDTWMNPADVAATIRDFAQAIVAAAPASAGT